MVESSSCCLCACCSGDFQTRLQSTDRDVHIRRLRRHGQSCRHCAGFGRLVLRARRFPSTPQAAEHVEFPARADVELRRRCRAVEVGCRIQHLPKGVSTDW